MMTDFRIISRISLLEINIKIFFVSQHHPMKVCGRHRDTDCSFKINQCYIFWLVYS